MYILVIILAVIFLVIKSTFSSQQKEIDTLKKEVGRLALKLDPIKITATSIINEEEKKQPSPVEEKKHPFPQITEATPVTIERKQPFPLSQVADNSLIATKKNVAPSKSLIKKLENYFATDITGVAGIMAIIAGVIFLSIYAAISLEAFGRFVLICMLSTVLYAAHVVLSKKAVWGDMALWMRSASGILFLCGCLAAVTIPYMRWITSYQQAYILIATGIAINTLFGFMNRKQTFACLHTVISLMALLILPFAYTSFVMASAITVIGIALSFKYYRWNLYVGVIAVSYTITHLIWATNSPSDFLQIPSIAIGLLLGIFWLSTHYSKSYKTSENNSQFMMARFILWACLGINLYIHSMGSWISTAGLSIGTVAAYILSSYAWKMKTKWLYICDRMATLAMLVIACLSLTSHNIEPYVALFLTINLSLVFLYMISNMKENTVFYATNILLLLLYLSAITITLSFIESNEITLQFIVSWVLSFVFLSAIFPNIERNARTQQIGFSIEDTDIKTTFLAVPFASFSVISMLLALNYELFSPYLFLIPILATSYIIFFRYKDQKYITDIACIAAVLITSIYCIHNIYVNPYPLTNAVILSLSVVLFSMLGLLLHHSRNHKTTTPPYIFALWMLGTVLAYVYAKDTMPTLTGILWLIIFLVSTEIKEIKIWKSESENTNMKRTLYILATASMFLFITRFLLVDISNNALAFSTIKLRIISEMFSIGCIVYWLTTDIYKKLPANYYLELLLGLSILYITHEVPVHYQLVIYSLAGFACYFTAVKIPSMSRLLVYSHCFYFASLFYIAFIVNSYPTPSELLNSAHLYAYLVSLLLSGCFMLFIEKKKKLFSNTEIPTRLSLLSRYSSYAINANVRILLYPMLFAVALFLYNGFEHSLLSFLWLFECFALFVISIATRNKEFRQVSMACVALICLRVIFYDLRGQDFLVKAIVFIGVGVLLICMNLIYNRYKHRYERIENE